MTDFNTFWQTYPSEFCKNKGSKTTSEAKWNKLDSKQQEHILGCIRELIRWDRHLRKQGDFVPMWPMVATFLNQERWRRIDDVNYTEDKQNRIVDKCKCGADVEWHGSQVGAENLCWACRDKLIPDPWLPYLRAEWREKGFNKASCREWLANNGYLKGVMK